MKWAMMIALVVIASGCGEAVSKDRATDAMEAAGYSDVHVTGQHGIAPEIYGCAKGDAVAFDVRAKNPAGKRTTATVCCGLILKGCTIRY